MKVRCPLLICQVYIAGCGQARGPVSPSGKLIRFPWTSYGPWTTSVPFCVTTKWFPPWKASPHVPANALRISCDAVAGRSVSARYAVEKVRSTLDYTAARTAVISRSAHGMSPVATEQSEHSIRSAEQLLVSTPDTLLHEHLRHQQVGVVAISVELTTVCQTMIASLSMERSSAIACS